MQEEFKFAWLKADQLGSKNSSSLGMWIKLRLLEKKDYFSFTQIKLKLKSQLTSWVWIGSDLNWAEFESDQVDSRLDQKVYTLIDLHIY